MAFRCWLSQPALKHGCNLLWEVLLPYKQLPATGTTQLEAAAANWHSHAAYTRFRYTRNNAGGTRQFAAQASTAAHPSGASISSSAQDTCSSTTAASSTASSSNQPRASPLQEVASTGSGQDTASVPEQHTPEHPQSGGPTLMESISPHLMDARSKAPLLSAQYASSADDKFGVQKNWFTALYKQLNYLAKTGSVPALKDRQRAVFEEVERDFERLYNKHIHGKGHDEDSHRALLMLCLASSTYRALHHHIEDTRLLRELIRTNLGSVMLALLKPLHRFKLRIFSWLLREDMYKEACKFLPALQRDMGALCDTSVQQGEHETMLTVNHCKYHEVLTQEETPFLLSEFCCHHALMWLHEFRPHGVVVSMDQCKAWDDQCCQLRIARTGRQSAAGQEPTP